MLTSLYTVMLYPEVPNLRVRPPPTGHQINLETIHEAGKEKSIFQVHVLLYSTLCERRQIIKGSLDYYWMN